MSHLGSDRDCICSIFIEAAAYDCIRWTKSNPEPMRLTKYEYPMINQFGWIMIMIKIKLQLTPYSLFGQFGASSFQVVCGVCGRPARYDSTYLSLSLPLIVLISDYGIKHGIKWIALGPFTFQVWITWWLAPLKFPPWQIEFQLYDKIVWASLT